MQELNPNTSNGSAPIIEEHLNRITILANRTRPMSRYIGNSILMMVPQVLGMRHYLNGSWQDCLNELNAAYQIESSLVADGNSATLVFARSAELLGMHLLLIYEKHQDALIWTNRTTYKLNGTRMSIEKFPSLALQLYKQADVMAPNRAINSVGMARSHAHLDQHGIAANLYQQLIFQMSSSNNTDGSFLKEPNAYLDCHNLAPCYPCSLALIAVGLICFIFQ